MSRLRIALTVVSLAVSAVACSGGGGSNSSETTGTQSGSGTSSTSGAVPGSASAPKTEAPAALQFTAPSVGGDAIDFTQFAGQTVALWFWAPT